MESFYQTLYSFGYTHPVHPTLVYLPIGCVMAAFIFGLTAALFNRANLLTSARHCIILASISSIPTIILGYMDWQYLHGGNLIFPIKMKMLLAALLVLLLAVTLLCQWRSATNNKSILALYTLCFFNVVAIGYYGGEIVFADFNKHIMEHRTSEHEEEEHTDSAATYAEVAEILSQHCVLCHKGSGAPYNLQLDTYEHVMEGGLQGKVVIPGNPDESELIRRVKGLSRPAMPYGGRPLTDDKITILTNWIQQGALKSEKSAQHNDG